MGREKLPMAAQRHQKACEETESAGTRSRILNAAGPVFADKGFRDATVRDICQAASVNLASVNYHFGDKQRLYIESVKEAHRRRFDQVPPPQWPVEARAEDKLRLFIETFAMRLLGGEEDTWQTRLMMREILQPTQACEELVQDYFRPQFNELLQILDEMVPASTSEARRHQMAFSIVGQCVYYRIAESVVRLLVGRDEYVEHYTATQLGEHIAGFSLAALQNSSTVVDGIE